MIIHDCFDTTISVAKCFRLIRSIIQIYNKEFLILDIHRTVARTKAGFDKELLSQYLYYLLEEEEDGYLLPS